MRKEFAWLGGYEEQTCLGKKCSGWHLARWAIDTAEVHLIFVPSVGQKREIILQHVSSWHAVSCVGLRVLIDWFRMAAEPLMLRTAIVLLENSWFLELGREDFNLEFPYRIQRLGDWGRDTCSVLDMKGWNFDISHETKVSRSLNPVLPAPRHICFFFSCSWAEDVDMTAKCSVWCLSVSAANHVQHITEMSWQPFVCIY